MPKDSGIGANVKRREDVRFLTGRGRFTDDISRPGQAYVHFLRSDVAHGRIARIDTSPAAAMPGVVGIFTGEDLRDVGSIPTAWLVTDRFGQPQQEPRYPVISHDKVRHVGDRIAAVVAESPAQARDAAEAIEVEIEELPAVLDLRGALAEGAPKVHDDLSSNLCFDWGFLEDNRAAVDAAFAEAHHVTTLELVNNRMFANPLEPRAAVGEYDAGDDAYTLWTTSQNPHVVRLLMGAFVLGIPEHKLRVVAPDVGGGFGTKIPLYPEEILCTFAAKRLGRPVKWTSSRSEALLADTHGRDHVTKVELALDAEGRFLAFRTDTCANLGAYLSIFGTVTPTYLHGPVMAGPYRTPLVYVNVKGVFTNTVPVDAYRGAGRPEATFQIERVVDKAAREMGIDPVEIRRRNFVPTDQFPYQTPVAVVYDTGNYHATLDKLLEISDHAGFEARRREAAARGKLRGWGLSTWIEACGLAPSHLVGQLGARAGLYESATVRVNATGSISVMTGCHSHGQGHETTFAQVVAGELGIDEAQVDIVHGDTGRIPFGMGTYGSRSIAVGGVAVLRATEKVIAKAKKIAAHLMEASEGDVEFAGGKFTVAGTDRSLAWGDVALAAYVPHNYPLETLEPGLEETAFYDPGNFTFPAGAYACEVEVDPETGRIEVVGFAAADDFGNVINPMIVDGQVHGGVVQGIGQALLEGVVYDPDGQLRTGSHMDYALPRAADVPGLVVDHSCQTPCTHNPLGVKGCGEAGAIGSPPAVVNAVIDALQRGGHKVEHIDMPLTPARVWAAMHAAACGGHPMYAFDFVKPSSIDEAVKALGQEDAQALAGGQTLIPALKQRLAQPSVLVSLRGISEIRGVRLDDAGRLCIGGGTPHAVVMREARAHFPALADLAGRIGDPAVRSLGTIGGSLANNDPSACYPAAVLATGATVVTNTREIAAEEFFQGMFTTALEEAEIITEVRFPVPERGNYQKFIQPASRFALVGVFVAKFADGVGVGVTGASEGGAFRWREVEDALGADFRKEALDGLSLPAEGMIGDLHGSPEYRAHLVKVLTGRAVAAA